MGRSITPKYVLEMGGFTNCQMTSSAWKGRLPKVADLQRLAMEFVVSTMPGFVNEVLGYQFGIQIPSFARIRENCHGGRVVVEWKAPMFQVLPDPTDFPELATMAAFWADTRRYLTTFDASTADRVLADRMANHEAYLVKAGKVTQTDLVK